jgi:hypothetical protein
MQAWPREGWPRLRKALLLASLIASVTPLGASSAHACSRHGTAAGNDITDWLVGDPDGDGLVEFFIGIENELLPPGTSTVCVCGIGLGTASNRLPPGADVTAAHVAVVDVASRTVTDLSAFVFSTNANTSAGLAAGSGPGGPPDTQPLFEGATWFGFASTVDPFSVPPLGPGEIVALGFDLDIPVEALPLGLEVQFAAGEGDASGNPLFSGDHPPRYFSGANPVVSLPEPASLLGELALATLALLRLGRRRDGATPRSRWPAVKG